MDNLVMIKSCKYGLQIHLNPEVSYEAVRDELEQKLFESAKFFQNAQMALSFEDRILTKDQEQELIDLIGRIAGIRIVCIMDQSKRAETTYKSIVNRSLMEVDPKDGQFYKGTLRKRQVLESETSLIVLGDVEAGAKIIAKGNVVVIGSLHGSVHAGAAGNAEAFVCALNMQPKKLKVADVEATRYILNQKTEYGALCQIAAVENGHIYMDPLV